MYTKPRWDATNAELRVWILEQFAKSLSGEFDNLLWPCEDPFELVLIRILNKYAPELRTWIEQQRRLGAYCEMEVDDDEEDEDEDEAAVRIDDESC